MTRSYTRDLPRITATDAEHERDRLFVMPEADLPADLGKAKVMGINEREQTPRPAVAPESANRPQSTFTIHALLDDFPFDVSFSGNADQLAATIARLREIGAVPPTQAARAAVEEERKREAPILQEQGVRRCATKS